MLVSQGRREAIEVRRTAHHEVDIFIMVFDSRDPGGPSLRRAANLLAR